MEGKGNGRGNHRSKLGVKRDCEQRLADVEHQCIGRLCVEKKKVLVSLHAVGVPQPGVDPEAFLA